MKLMDINLSVKRGLFRSDDPTSDEANTEFKKIRKKILERDNYTCRYCGFRSDKYQEVHHLDDNHSNNSESNLITTCSLCHACFHIGLAGIKKRGVLIHIPSSENITQAKLNQLIRALWIGERGGNKNIAIASISAISRLNKRTVEARRVIGTSDPTILGDFLLNLSEDKYKGRQDVIKGIYLLPLRESFEKQIAYWSQKDFSGIPPSSWADISRQKIERWSENKIGGSSDAEIKKMLNIE